METEPEAAEAEPSLSTQENSQDSLTDAAVGGLTQEESLGAEPVAAKPPRPSVRFAVEEAPPRPAVRFAASPAKARGVTFAPLAGATPFPPAAAPPGPRTGSNSKNRPPTPSSDRRRLHG